ncbi:MAG: hypothetical protein ACI4MP_14550 [Candidatus Ventricola sp.]
MEKRTDSMMNKSSNPPEKLKTRSMPSLDVHESEPVAAVFTKPLKACERSEIADESD